MSVLKDLAYQTMVGVPPPPARFTHHEWNLNNREKLRVINNQQQLADNILEESERISEKVSELVIRNKSKTDFRIEERLKDLDFIKKEILAIRKKNVLEEEALRVYKERIIDCLKTIEENAMIIVKKCILFREHRLGIDLVHDDVERQLLKEIQTIEGVQTILKKSLEQTNEQIRRIKAQFYALDRDLADKEKAIKLDYANSGLKLINLEYDNLSGMNSDRASLNASTITYDEWSSFTHDNLVKITQEQNNCPPLRSFIDNSIRQCIEDLITQRDYTNAAFRLRIAETKEAKKQLEARRAETTRLGNEMSRNITRLKTSLADKERFMALAQTRLINRAQRSGIEQCHDHVESGLCDEVMSVREGIKAIQQMLVESIATLHCLMRTQIQMEEDINIKTNSIKIDEVDCMTLRESLDYNVY